jgi:outer membrane protein assembly factor BamB
MNRRSVFAILTSISFVLIGFIQAADWPQWRGPNRDGISKEIGLQRSWPSAGPKLLWQIDTAGSGYSTPAVVGQRIYLLGSTGDDNEFVKALDVSSGKEIWTQRIGKVGRPDQKPPYPGCRSTPTVDGEVLYVLGSDGDMACLETAGGKIRWSKNVTTEFGGDSGIWAFSESPLVDGNNVVCTPGGKDAAMVAFNKKSGDVVWKCELPEAEKAAYSSIVVASSGDNKQYVQFLGKKLIGVNAKDGKLLWTYSKTAEGSPANIPTPVVDGNFIYSSTGRGGGGLIKLNGTAEPEQIYAGAKLPNAIGGSVKIGNYLYGTNSQALNCIEFATGDVKWTDRCIGAAAICFADSLLFLHGENGDAALVEATPDEYREKGRFTPPNQPEKGNTKAWAYPVVANGRLYLRDAGMLWCYDVAATRGAE